LVVDPTQRFVIADLGSKLLFYEFVRSRESLVLRNTLEVPNLWPNAFSAPWRIVMHPNGRFAFFISGQSGVIQGMNGGGPIVGSSGGSAVSRNTPPQAVKSDVANIGTIEFVPGVGGKMLTPQGIEAHGSVTLDPKGEYLFVTSYRHGTQDVLITTYRVDSNTGRATMVASSIMCVENCAQSVSTRPNDSRTEFMTTWMVFGPSEKAMYVFLRSDGRQSKFDRKIIVGRFDPRGGKITWRSTKQVEASITNVVPDRKNQFLYVLSPGAQEVVVFREGAETGELTRVTTVAWRRPFLSRLLEFSSEVVEISERDSKDGKALVPFSRLVAASQALTPKFSLPFRCVESKSGWCLRDRFDSGLEVTLLGMLPSDVCLAKTGNRKKWESESYTPIDVLDRCNVASNYFLAVFNLSVKTYELARSSRIDSELEERRLDTQTRQSGVFERALNKRSRRLDTLHGEWSIPKGTPQVRAFVFSDREYKLATWKNGYCDQPSVLIGGEDVSFLTTVFGRHYRGRSSSITIISINGQSHALVVGPMCGADFEGRTVVVVYRLDAQTAVPVYVNANWRFGQ
jgi:hypothetical protein